MWKTDALKIRQAGVEVCEYKDGQRISIPLKKLAIFLISYSEVEGRSTFM